VGTIWESQHERLQRQMAEARTSGPMRSRTSAKAPHRAWARLRLEKTNPQHRRRAIDPAGAVCAWCQSRAAGIPAAALGPHPRA
jgi:hypothetical protein